MSKLGRSIHKAYWDHFKSLPLKHKLESARTAENYARWNRELSYNLLTKNLPE